MESRDADRTDDAVRGELNRHAAAQMRQAVPAMVLGAVAVALLLHGHLAGGALQWWLVAAGLDIVRVVLRIRLDEGLSRATHRWQRSRAWDVLNHASFGLLWGGLVVLAGVWGDDAALWPALLIVMAVMAMAVVASAGATWRFVTLATGALGPSALVLLLRPGWRLVGVLVLVFAGILTAVHRTMNRALAEAVRTGEENRALARELGEFLADRDPATALLNRRGFQMAVEAQAATAAAGGRELAVTVANVERLAAVNELFDDRTGDAVLDELASRLRARADRDGVAVARLGGDEFALAAPVGAADLDRLWRDVVAEPIVVVGRSLHIELHVADAVGPPERAAELTVDATAQLRRLRAQRRPTLHSSPDPLPVRRALLEDLPAALRSGAVQPWFQPLVSARTHEIDGWEALVRWRHPGLGVLTPDRFLPLAVMGGHAAELTDVVLAGSLRFLAESAATGSAVPKVHVNILPADLRRPGFCATVLALLKAHDVSADALVLEITEQDLLALDPVVVENIEQLDRCGVDFAVDDFGTGFSSLSHLQRLPIRQLKIDRSFVARLEERRSLTLVEGIVGLARGMRLGVVAEGVETEQQAAMLTAAGCTELQGYLFGRPAAPETINAARVAGPADAHR